jgi:flavin-dependent dehydrogenase
MVRVFERAPGSAARLPETLYPAARAELERLGVALPPSVPTAVRLLSADGSIAIRMEIEAPRQMAAIDRAALDRNLRETALAAGAEIQAGRPIIAIEPAGADGWRLVDTAGEEESAALVIDATGKAAFAAGRLVPVSTEVEPLDPRSSVFTHYERAEAFGIDAVTLIGSADGFFYLVPLHAHRLCVGCVRYAPGQPDEDGFQAAIAACIPLQPLLAGASRVLPMLPAKNAASRVTPAVPGLFVTGDALGFHDPFLWDGIFHALRSGSRAGALAADVALGRIGREEAGAAHDASLRDVAACAVPATRTALAPFAGAFAPVLLHDPHMPSALLAALLGLARNSAEADARTLLERRRAGMARKDMP